MTHSIPFLVLALSLTRCFSPAADVVGTTSSASSSTTGAPDAPTGSMGDAPTSTADLSSGPSSGTTADTADPSSGTAHSSTTTSTTSSSSDASSGTTAAGTAEATSEAPEPCGFALTWCMQLGLDQFTRCQDVTDDGHTCLLPEIRYGETEIGVPIEHVNNDLDAWCTQLGFAGMTAVTYGNRVCAPTYGRVFGCDDYEDLGIVHWCDYLDGFWHNMPLDAPCYADIKDYIVSITCA